MEYLIARKNSNDLLYVAKTIMFSKYIVNSAFKQGYSTDEVKSFKKIPDFDPVKNPFYIVKTLQSI